MSDYIVTYQKRNGEIFLRKRKNVCDLQIGITTSMGWKVLDIHEEYEGNYLHREDIKRFIRKKKYKPSIKKQIIRYIVKKLNRYA